MYWNQWHLFLEGYKRISIQNTYYATQSSSCSLPYLIIPLSMQPLAKSINCDQIFLLRNTWVFSLVMRIYRPQYTDRVCCDSPSSCSSFVTIEVDGDILCLLLVEIVCATKQSRHLENINDNQAEAGTLHIVDKECNSWATELMNRQFAMHKQV